MPPDQISMEPGETVIKILYKHPISLLPVILSVVLVVAAGLFASAYVVTNPNLFGVALPAADITMGFLLLDILMALILILSILIFRQNRIILTNKHLIQVIQNGLLSRSLSKFTLDELQDVKGSRTGLFATILDYGVLLIETAGAQQTFKFGPVADPISTAELINDTHEQFEQAHIYIRQ
jgi:uncharacterized membrane protein YdbT with pleckstrin-like domain